MFQARWESHDSTQFRIAGHLTDILAITNFEAEIVAWHEHWQRRTIEPGIRINRPDDENMRCIVFKSAGLAQWMPATVKSSYSRETASSSGA
jgi:hypothetical protein